MVRMGKNPKGWTRRANASSKKGGGGSSDSSTSSTPSFQVGRVSPNLMTTVYAPLLTRLSELSAEEYASLHEYVDKSSASSSLSRSRPSHLYSSKKNLDELSAVLSETSREFSSSAWKVSANAAKFERQLEEKYGMFLPLMVHLKTNHPQLEQQFKSVTRKYALLSFSPFREGDGPMSVTSSVILLFMMQRNGVRWEGMVLASLFLLVGLQPWALLVCLCLGNVWRGRRFRRKPVGWRGDVIAPVKSFYSSEEAGTVLKREVGGDWREDIDLRDSDYDSVVLGSGVTALYSAALLSRTGRKVLVLNPSNTHDASDTTHLFSESALYKSSSASADNEWRGVPFDIGNSKISNIGNVQSILAPALATESDTLGGIRFTPLGSPQQGYTHSILSIPGMGASRDYPEGEPFLLRGLGGDAFNAMVADTSLSLNDGFFFEDSVTATFVNLCGTMHKTASGFFMNKLLSGINLPFDYLMRGIGNKKKNKAHQPDDTAFGQAAVRPSSAFLSKVLKGNMDLMSLFAGIGCLEEDISPKHLSFGVLIGNVEHAARKGGHYTPVGGMRAVCHALATVVEQNGGKIINKVPILELVFDTETTVEPANSDPINTQPPPSPHLPPGPMITGIKLTSGAIFSPKYNDNTTEFLSCLGFIKTFLHCFPDDVRFKYGVPKGLPALTERRPQFKVFIVLDGSKDDLELSCADWYRLPSASAASIMAAQQEEEEEHAATTPTEGGEEKDSLEGTATQQPPPRPKRSKSQKNKFTTGQSYISISFPSVKDPMFDKLYGASPSSSKQFSTCAITVEADDDFCKLLDTKPNLFMKNKYSADTVKRLVDRVMKDLVQIYPQLDGKILHTELQGPFHTALSHTPQRYAAPGITPTTHYPNLFMGGSDLTFGTQISAALVGGWMGVNAMVGYDAIDYWYLNKNITQDITMFMDYPERGRAEEAMPLEEVEIVDGKVCEVEKENEKKEL